MKPEVFNLGLVLTTTLFCENARVASFWPTVHTDPENTAPENTLFWKRVSGWRNPITQPSRFHVDGILSEMMAALPRPSTSCLRPLSPATSHNNNNNNGGLHARVRAAEDIEPFLQLTHIVVECESQQQFDLINGPHQRFWFPCTSHFNFLLVVFGFYVYCLFVYSAQAKCACSVSSSAFLVNVKRHLEARNRIYSVFGHFKWIRMDANILETMPRKTEERKIVFARVDGPLVSEVDQLVGSCGVWKPSAAPLIKT